MEQQKIEKLNIIDSIHLGLRRGYVQNLQFRNNWSGFEDKMTEYLLTVFVALEMNKFNGFGKNVDIQLEYPLYQFYNNAFPASRWSDEDDFFAASEFLTRDFKEDQSKKRIDIAVMYNEIGIYGHYRSLIGIEIKAINQNYNLIKKDVFRLASSMINEDKIDTNSIEKGYSAFIVYYSNGSSPTTENDMIQKRVLVSNDIDDLLNNNFRKDNKFACLDFIFHSDAISSSSLESLIEGVKHIPNYDLSLDPVNETGEVLSFVIEIKRKKS